MAMGLLHYLIDLNNTLYKAAALIVRMSNENLGTILIFCQAIL